MEKEDNEGKSEKARALGARSDFNMPLSHELCGLTTRVALCACLFRQTFSYDKAMKIGMLMMMFSA